MPDPWMPGLIHDPGKGAGYAVGTNAMYMGVDHDTGGTNSYEIVKNGRPDAPSTLANILLPKVGVPWQFCEIDAKVYHAGSSTYGDYNPKGPGIEVERLQGEPLSPDQIEWLGKINAWCASEWGLPDIHYWGPQFPWWGADFHGWVNHRDIHPNPDGLSEAEWDEIAAPPVPVPTIDLENLMEFTKNPHKTDEVWCLTANTRRHVGPKEWSRAQTPLYPGGPYKLLSLAAEEFDSYPEAG